MCPKKIHLFYTITFVTKTVDLRVMDILSQLKNKISDTESFSLSLDELTDVIDATQLFI